MDGLELFRKLGFGAKLDFTRFHKDAEKLKIKNVKETPLEKGEVTKCQNLETSHRQQKRKGVELEGNAKRIKIVNEDDDNAGSEASHESDEDADFHVLGNMKARSGKDVKLARQKRKKKSKVKRATLHQEKISHLRHKHHIHVHGSDVPAPVTTFEQLHTDYNLHQQIVKNLQQAGFNEPTPIQMQAVPVMLQKREILACAPTGSGKTAAFILPVLHHLKEPRKQGFRAVILSPTRELATQTYREFNRLSENRGFRIFLIEQSGSAVKKFGPKSSLKFDILVTTPNRLIHLLKQDPPSVNLSSVEWLIVDESDKLFEEGKTGFRDQLAAIYQACDSPNIRRAMFSATFSYEVEEWCKMNLDNVVQVYVGARNAATETIEQELLYVGNEYGKLVAFRDIIRKGLQPPMLIFVQSKERAKELFHELIYDGINVDVIHADRTQTQRDNVVKGFRSGKIWVLVCTELMGRGIDFKGVNIVVNFDFPTSAISYIHRIGRTGRAGRSGRAVTLFTEDDAKNLRSIANVMKGAGCPVPDYMLQISKPRRKVLKKLARTVPSRQTIRTVPKFEIQKAKDRRKKLRKQRNSQSEENQSNLRRSTEKKALEDPSPNHQDSNFFSKPRTKSDQTLKAQSRTKTETNKSSSLTNSS